MQHENAMTASWFRRDIAVSPSELAAEQLTGSQYRQALLLLHTRGYVILRGAIPRPLVDAANETFATIFRDCVESRNGDDWYQVSRGQQAVFWQRGARWRIFPKLRLPLANPWLLTNPLCMPLVTNLLGDDCTCKFVASDTCIRGSEWQSPHRELGCGQGPPRAYIVNIPLMHCGPHNGPLEIWPGGTHLWSNELLQRWQFGTDVQDGHNPEIEEYAKDWPSVKVDLRPGDLLIRDPGLLHRGTPNPTDEPRTMLTVCFFRQGHAWDYGRIDYNLDANLFAKLDPSVQRYFAFAFATPAPAHPGMWQRLSSAWQRKSA